MQHKRPVLEDWYGTPLWYRIEHRKSGDVIVISYRDEKGRVQYEAPPIGGKKISDGLRRVVGGERVLPSLPEEVMAEVLRGWIGLHTLEGCRRRKNEPELTLGVLLTADKRELLYETGSIRSEATVKDEERTFRSILECWGTTPWREVTPETCAEWLARKPLRAKKDIKRLMCRHEMLQLRAGIIDSVTWGHYQPKDNSRKRMSHKSLVQAQVEQVVLTDGQCRKILNLIQRRIDDGSVTEIDFAILLVMVALLTIEEIAALVWEDLSYLADFPTRLTVEVKNSCQKEKKKSRLVEIEDPYRRRKIPLPAIAERCYRALAAKRTLEAQQPVVHSKHSRSQRMAPDALKRTIAAHISDVEIEKVTDTEGVKARTAAELLFPTGMRALERAGIEDEELRALSGKRPKLTSGKYYYDRNSEVALEKIGALQDRWTESLCGRKIAAADVETVRLKGAGVAAKWRAAEPSQRTMVMASLELPPVLCEDILKDGVRLELSALYGYSGSVKF